MIKNKKYIWRGFLISIQDAKLQLRGLNAKNPFDWPPIPKVFLCMAIVFVVLVGSWYFYLNSVAEDLNVQREEESALRVDYQNKLRKAVALEALRKQREQVQQYVIQLEKQLPSKSEMDALLSDINQAGLGRSLQFELFRPGGEVVKEYYAELPITVKISGVFHDIGMFASDIAHLSRIVNLSNVMIAPKSRESVLTLDATVHTYRYLDDQEINTNRNGKSK